MFIKQRIEQFVSREGRRPRILVSNIGRENHDHDTKLLAAFFAESGFDVDISPLHQTSRGTARMANENDVHVICFFSTERRLKTMITDLKRDLKAEQVEKVKIVIGGAIPRSDYQFLYDAGVDLILNSVPADEAEIHFLLDLFE
ncbi:MAG: cobalamin-dependent protein [Desulfobacterales bacterium]